MAAGHAYYCFCSSERLEELKTVQQANKLPTGYDKHCRNLTIAEIDAKLASNPKPTLRMKMPETGETTFTDSVRGVVTFKNELVDDQIIIKSDGFPTYHFAVVVDDHLMEITHVIRGEDWMSSTPKHIQLYKYFGWEIPQFAHLPLLLNADKTKLSKRQGDVAVEEYIKKGYLPAAMVNFVALLGWNPGTDQEIFSLPELIQEFSLEKIHKSGAFFNLEKLDWFNQQHLRRLNAEQLVAVSLPWLIKAGLVDENVDKDWLVRALNLEKERITTLAELPDALKFVFVEKLEFSNPQILVWKKGTVDGAKTVLTELADFFREFSEEWSEANLELKLKEWIVVKNYTNGEVLWPLRVALSGKENSPGPFAIAAVLGQSKTLDRIKTAEQILL